MNDTATASAPRFSRFTRVALGVAGFLLVAAAALWVVLATPAFRSWLRDYTVRNANRYLNGELYVESIGGTLLTGVALNNVMLRMHGDDAVSVGRIIVDYDLRDLIMQGLRFDRLRLERPVVHAVETAEGWNLASILVKREPGEPGQRPAIAIDEIEIANGQVLIDSIDDGPVDLPARVEDLNGVLSLSSGREGLEVDIERLSLAASDPTLRVHELSGRIQSSPDALTLENLSLRLDETDLWVDGTMTRGDDDDLDFRVVANPVSLGEIARIVPGVGNRSLAPAIDATVTGTPDALDLSFRVSSVAGRVEGAAKAMLRDSPRLVTGSVDLEEFDVAAVAGRVPTDMTGHVDFEVTLPAEGPMQGRYAFSGPHAVVLDYETTDIEVEGTFRGRALQVEGRAAAYGGSATAAGHVELPMEGRPLTLDVRGRAANIDLRRLPPHLPVPDLASDLEASSYRFQRTASGFRVDAVLDPSVVEGARFAAETTAYAASEPAGVISFGARGHVTGLDVQRFGAPLELETIQRDLSQSRLTGGFEVNGRYQRETPLVIDVRADLSESMFAGAHLPGGVIEAHLADRRLATETNLAFAGLDVSRVFADVETPTALTGRYDGTIEFADIGRLTPGTVTAAGQLTLEPSTIGELEIDKAVVSGSMADGLAQVVELAAEGPNVEVNAAGTAALDDTHTSDLAFDLRLADLSALEATAKRPLEGNLVAKGRLTGNRGVLATAGTFDLTEFETDGYEMLSATGQFGFTVPELSLWNATGTVDTQMAFLRIRDTEIASATLKASYAAQRLDFDALLQEGARELQAAGALVWHPEHREVHLTGLTARSEAFEWQLQPRVTTEAADVAIRYGRDSVAIHDVTLVSGTQRINVSGELPLSDDAGGPGLLHVVAEGVDLRQLDQLLGFEYGAAGLLSGDARIEGSLDSPRVSADVQVDAGQFGSYAYERLTAALDPAGDRLLVDARLDQSPMEWISIRGSVPLVMATTEEPATAQGALDLQVQTSTIGLGVVQAFTKVITEVQGNLQADVHVGGTLQTPDLEGRVVIQQGSFTVPATGVSYSNLDTVVQLLDDRVELQAFELLDGSGRTLRVGGELAFEGRRVQTFDLTLSSTGVQVLDNELGDVEVTSDLHVSGAPTEPLITGDVVIVDGQIEINQVLSLVEMRRRRSGLPQAGLTFDDPEDEEDEEEPPTDPTGLALDIDVRIPDNLVLRGSSPIVGSGGSRLPGALNVTLGGTLAVATVPGETIRVRGAVHTVRGTYEFQGRQFEVSRDGMIRFQGGPDIDPFLDVRATRTISGVDAHVDITGSLREPMLALSSNPPLDSADIMALIIFNQPLTQLGTDERVSVAQQAGALATGVLTSPLAASINQALGFDRFELGATSGLESAAVTVGEQVGERLFVKFTQHVGAAEYSQFVLEFRFSDYLRLQTALTEGSTESERSLTTRTEQAGVDFIYVLTR